MNEYMTTYRYPYPNELYHYGVLGMKWGVRRYQNKDGSLTPKGKAHLKKLDTKEKRDVVKKSWDRKTKKKNKEETDALKRRTRPLNEKTKAAGRDVFQIYLAQRFLPAVLNIPHLSNTYLGASCVTSVLYEFGATPAQAKAAGVASYAAGSAGKVAYRNKATIKNRARGLHYDENSGWYRNVP